MHLSKIKSVFRRTSTFYAVFFLFSILCRAADPVVSNVQFAQTPGTKLVEITYDVADADGDTLTASVERSLDGGATWLSAPGATGDVGSGITPGIGKRITWDAGAHDPGQLRTNVRFRITAIDADPSAQLPADMVFVEGGTFTMGDEFGDGDPDELPLHEVTLSSFAIGRYEVTKALWDEVATWAASNGYDISASTASAHGDGGDYPAHSMDWFQMVKWCNARSEREGLTPAYRVDGAVYRTGDQAPTCDFSASGYRLPTEAEWEYAAKGGKNGTRTKYAGSDNLNAVAWYSSNSGITSHPVGTKQANELDLYDMSGNLLEWCWDWYASFSSASAVDPTGPGSGSYRVRRGGGWHDGAQFCRVANRGGDSPDGGNSGVGFRLARSVRPSEMVFVEGGSFTMGDEFGDGESDELPLHLVTLSSFVIGRYEVTKTLWDEVATWAAANGYDISPSTASSHGGGGDYPAHSMTWFQMVKWCNARSEREGLTPAYRVGGAVYRAGDQAPTCDFSASGYRLPTEAEWEYAAKGGKYGTQTKYAGSDSIDAVAWYGSNSGGTSHPVGTKQANELGLYDMSGNLWEWCWDWFGSYSSTSAVDPTGPASGSSRVPRGSDWSDSAIFCRVASRGYFSPGYGDNSIGFRLARSIRPTDMVFVEGGTFTMGDEFGDGNPDELPLHEVTLSSFEIGRYEVTKALWDEVAIWAAANGYDISASGASAHGGGDYPAQWITWYEVVKWCNAHSEREGLTPAYRVGGAVYRTGDQAPTCDFSASGYRLPTEAEWEYAAKGGKYGTRTKYAGSDNLNAVAWYSSNSGSHPIGTKQANELGLYDMSGNLSEWCWDWYGAYLSGSDIDPVGIILGSTRVNRGGHWGNYAQDCRVANRGNGSPGFSDDDLGFRLARSVRPSEMVFVEGGTFTMGDEFGDGNPDELPLHEVTLSSFEIGRYEVTKALWDEVAIWAAANGYDISASTASAHGGGGDYPAHTVTWFEVVKWCNARSEREGLAPAYRVGGAVYRTGDQAPTCDFSASGYRLPTEAEWEYAAKGGKNGTMTKYAGSDDIDAVAWYDNNSGSTSLPVGTKQTNELGLYDMSGNLSEWCWDWYGAFSSGSDIDPVGTLLGSTRVNRGGHWPSSAFYCRVAFRGSDSPGFSGYDLGFRLARSVPSADMVFVESGTFTIGDEFGDGDSDELPLHEVTLSSFAIGKYEVTKALWDEVATWAAANGYDISASGASAHGGGDYPAHSVTWFEVVKWCNARSEREGLTPAYRVGGAVYRAGDQAPTCDFSASGYRLPTEAEWEYAAKGGKNGTMTKYAGSDNVDAVAWYDNNSGSTSLPVGTKQANELGLYDMSGNLSEWCWDWYGAYSSGSANDPVGALSGSSRVDRGGSWLFSAMRCRVAFRGSSSPGFSGYDLGFRLARSSGPLLAVSSGDSYDTRDYTVTAVALPSAGGSVTRSPDKATYAWRETVTLTAQPSQSYNFAGWSGDLASNTNPVTLAFEGATSLSVAANFSEQPVAPTITAHPQSSSVERGGSVRLSAAATGTGPLTFDWHRGGTLLKSSSESWIDLTDLQQTAGYSVKVWNAQGEDWSNAATVTVNLPRYTLTTAVTGSGSISRSPDAVDYEEGSQVTLTASPAAGQQFTGWSGDASGAQNPIVLTMDRAKSVTAGFVLTPFNLEASRAAGRVRLLWETVDGAVYYDIQKAIGDGGWTLRDSLSAPATAFQDSEVAEGFRYRYRIEATDANFQIIRRSVEVEVDFTGELEAPVLTFASKGNSADSVLLEWSAIATAANYRVRYSPTRDPEHPAFVAQSPGNRQNWEVLGVPVGWPFYFFVQAENSFGTQSSWSNWNVGWAGNPIVSWGKTDPLRQMPTEYREAVDLKFTRDCVVGLLADGRVVAWSWAEDAGRVVADLPSIGNAVAIAAGYDHALALLSDGSVRAWGGSDPGVRAVPQEIAAVVEIAAGNEYSLALLDNGTVRGWGLNHDGVLDASALDALDTVVALAAGGAHALALHPDGSVSAWGRNVEEQTQVPDPLPQVQQIAAGEHFSVALTRSGEVIAWGGVVDGVSQLPPELRPGGGAAASRKAGGQHPAKVVRAAGPVDVQAVSGYFTTFVVAARNGTPTQYEVSGTPAKRDGSAQYVAKVVAGPDTAVALQRQGQPRITRQAQGNPRKLAGDDLLLVVGALGEGAMQWRWTHDGKAVDAEDYEGGRLFLRNLQAADAGIYIAEVSNGGEWQAANPIDLRVLDGNEADPLFDDATAYPEGWLNSPWFGWVQKRENSWYYSNELGFIYTPSASPEVLYLWCHNLNRWAYTARSFWTGNNAFIYLFGPPDDLYGPSSGWHVSYRGPTPGNDPTQRWFYSYPQRNFYQAKDLKLP